MKKSLLLFVLISLPFFGFSQVDLVRWNGTSKQSAPNVLVTNISAGNITGPNVNFIVDNWGSPNSFQGSEWPSADAPDYTKYMQMSISANAGYKIDLNELKFNYFIDNDGGPSKFEVRYSTDPSFSSNGTFLLNNSAAVKNSITTQAIALTGITVLPLTTLYVRIYAYKRTNVYWSGALFRLQHSLGGTTGPTFKGTVSPACSPSGNQTTYGNDSWIGYAYNNSANANPTTAPFLTGNYKGYITETETFDRNLGATALSGTNLCGTYSDNFAIRYRMKKNFPAGNYIFTVGGDDGYRLSLDGGQTFVINNWNTQSYTKTSTTTIALTNGNKDLVLEYFENGGDSRISFNYGTCVAGSLTAPNSISGNSTIDCSNNNVTLTATGGTEVTGSSYEWGTGSTIGSNIIAGQTGISITVSPATTTTYWVRRVGPAPCLIKTSGISKSVTVSTINAPGNPEDFGNNTWNVYAFAAESMTPALATYKGFYTQNTLGLDTQDLTNNGWNNTTSPSSSAAWTGCPVAVNQFTMIHKRMGFPCDRYNITINNWDDATKVFIDGVQVFTAPVWSGSNPIPVVIGNYALNANSKIEVITIENSGGANVKLSLTATNTVAIYNGSLWSTPPNGLAVQVESDLQLYTDLNVCSCKVQSGATLTINNGATLKVDDFVNVATYSNLIVENNASLVQVNNAAINTGSITVKRNSAPMKLYDYTYWSSPVKNWKLNQLSPNTGYYYGFDPLTNNWAGTNGGNQVMTAGKGYIIRAPQGWSTTNATLGVYKGTFNGVPNNGVIPVTIQKGAGTFNLIGNPYPSAIDIDLFLSDPANSGIINGTVYIWTHNTAISSTIPGNAVYNYTNDDYAKYNLTGGVKTALTSITGGLTPNGKIASGQGFFIEANTALANGTYTANFKNSMRVAGSNNQFYKTNAVTQSATNTIEKNRIWLNISNPQGAYNETLLGYVTNATNGFDNLYDGKTFPAGNVLSLYSIVGTDNYSIQGRALPFNESEIIPLGYTTSLAGTFSIAIEDLDGFFTNQNVYLLDKSSNTTHNLKTSAYSFTTATGTFKERFELRFTNTTLGTDNPTLNENEVTIYSNGKQVNIKSTLTMESVAVYDLLGRQIFSADKINAMNFQTSDLTATNQVLIVKVKLADNYEVAKKVMME